jgi:hypothetical protein
MSYRRCKTFFENGNFTLEEFLTEFEYAHGNK